MITEKFNEHHWAIKKWEHDTKLLHQRRFIEREKIAIIQNLKLLMSLSLSLSLSMTLTSGNILTAMLDQWVVVPINYYLEIIVRPCWWHIGDINNNTTNENKWRMRVSQVWLPFRQKSQRLIQHRRAQNCKWVGRAVSLWFGSGGQERQLSRLPIVHVLYWNQYFWGIEGRCMWPLRCSNQYHVCLT